VRLILWTLRSGSEQYLRMSRKGSFANMKGVGHRERKREGNKDVFHGERKFCKKNMDIAVTFLFCPSINSNKLNLVRSGYLIVDNLF
jgi:hypothetical protein